MAYNPAAGYPWTRNLSRLHNVISDISDISDITGETGLRIVRAILGGERDPARLAALRHRGILASIDDIVRSLQGHGRDGHLFALRQAMSLYDAYTQALQDCQAAVAEPADKPSRVTVDEPAAPRRGRRPSSQAHRLGLALHRALGVDLTRIDGIGIAHGGDDLASQSAGAGRPSPPHES